VIRMNTINSPHGPHTDQEVRDALDDFGLIATYDNAVGSIPHLMEVMG
jgi:hypothetical protein